MLLKSRPITLAEAAERSCLAVATIREHVRNGVLVRAKLNGVTAVTAESFDRFLFDVTAERAARAARKPRRLRPVLRLVIDNTRP